jgi:membrane dipeptidase
MSRSSIIATRDSLLAELPLGMEDVTRLPRIAQALLDRGWAEADVTKTLGGNTLRVMTRVLHATPR